MFKLWSDVKSQIGKNTTGDRDAKISSASFLALQFAVFATGTSCVLVTAKNFIGDNINCIAGTEKQELKAIESYCFISSTFSVVNLSSFAPHPGVGPYDHKDGERLVHAYYQWVPFIMAMQCAVLYLPVHLWNMRENKFLKMIVMSLDKVHVDHTEVITLAEQSAAFVARRFGHNKKLALAFLACECLGFGIAVGNLYFTNTFLGGKFFYFGPGALGYLASGTFDPNNPLNEIFPKMTKCTWHRFGPSGTIMRYDALCVLPLNIVNEKTYIFLWIIYVATAVVTGVALLWHLILSLVPWLQTTLIVWRAGSSELKLHRALHGRDLGDRFLIYQIKRHIVYFDDWVDKLSEALNNRK